MSKTTIDLIFTNKPDRISKTFNFLSGLSDHNFNLCSRKIKRQHLDTYCTRVTHHHFIPKDYQQNLKNELQQLDWANVLNNNDIDARSDILTKSVKDILAHFTKKREYKQQRKKLPWLNDDIRKLMKERDHALKKIFKNRDYK